MTDSIQTLRARVSALKKDNAELTRSLAKAKKAIVFADVYRRYLAGDSGVSWFDVESAMTTLNK